MNLGAKIALIVLSIGLIAGGTIFSAAAIIFTEDFEELEKRDGEARMALLQEELDSDVLEMRATVGEFVQIAAILVAAPESDFTANLTAQLLSGNNVDAFGFGLNGTIQGMEFDWASRELVNSTLPVFSVLANSTYGTNTDFSQTLSGFIQGETRYIAASQAMSFGNLSANLIILRAMDADYLAALQAETGLELEWHNGVYSGVEPNGSVLTGAIDLYDDQGNSIGSLYTEMDREITENAERTLIVLGLGYVVVVLVFGALIVFLLKKFVLGRVRTARESMETIARDKTWDAPMDLGGNDEIARMANQFNVLMGELEESQTKLIETNSSLERYARSLSHDLRSPLSTLNLNLALIAMRDDGEEIPKMQRTVKRIDELILSLLEDAKMRAAGFSDANAALSNVLEDMEAEIAAQSATIEVGALPLVPLTQTPLRSLLQNLIGNSIKFHKGFGATVQVYGGTYAGGTYLIIKDDGIGMSQEKLEEVKEEFVGDGYGIGLATCYGIMDSVGIMDIESQEGVGTQITLWFED